MKKIAILLLSLCAVSFASATEVQKRNVAVYMSGEEPTGAKGAHRVLGAELAKAITLSGDYAAVDRTEAILEVIGKEHEYQRSGAVSDDQIKDLGYQLGVRYLCVASVSEMNGGLFLEARLVDVVTAEVVKVVSSGVSGFMGGGHGLIYAAQRVARSLIPGARVSNPRFYVDAQAGYYMSAGDDDISGVMGAIGATGFVNPDHFHRVGLSAGISGLYAFGSGESEIYDYDVSVSSLHGFLSGVYRAGYKTRYVDASFSANLSLYGKTRLEGYVNDDHPDITDNDRDFNFSRKNDSEFSYSIDMLGRYEYIGGGVGRVLSDDATSIYVSGYIPAHKKIEVVPSITIQIGDVTQFILSLGAQMSF